MDLSLALHYAPFLLLHFVRTGAFFAAAPIFGTQTESRMLRLVLSITLGALFWWVNTDWAMHAIGPLPIDGLLHFAGLAAREGLIGFAAGFSLQAIVTVLAVAGEILAHEMGFTMSRIMDPVTGISSTSMAQVFQIMAYLTIFNLNLHHQFIRVIESSFAHVPVGQGFDIAVVYAHLDEMVTASLDFGLRYAAPIFGVMILLTVTLVILARAVQNINLMEFAFPLRILLALNAAVYFLEEGQPFLVKVFGTIFVSARQLFLGA